jgi:hypothetical protein
MKVLILFALMLVSSYCRLAASHVPFKNSGIYLYKDSIPKKHYLVKQKFGKQSSTDTTFLKFVLPLKDGYYTMDLGDVYIKDTSVSVVKFWFKNNSPYKLMYVAVANCWNDTQGFDFEENKLLTLEPNQMGYLTCNIFWGRKKIWRSITYIDRTFKVFAHNGTIKEYKLCFKAMLKD